MHINLRIYLSLFVCLFSVNLNAQNFQYQEKKLIQFSGIVVTGDSLDPVPFTNVIVKGTKKGTVSDRNGFFSFVAQAGDVIEFSALGFKSAHYIISDTFRSTRYSWIQVLNTDTIYLTEAVIIPWPTVEQFKRAFVQAKIPNDDQQRAEKNLNLAEMKERMKNMPMDGSMNYRNYVDQQIYKNYYKGQYAPNNLLNPFAWAQFIKAWKEGKFKDDDSQ
jgi:hypothetical protein